MGERARPGGWVAESRLNLLRALPHHLAEPSVTAAASVTSPTSALRSSGCSSSTGPTGSEPSDLVIAVDRLWDHIERRLASARPEIGGGTCVSPRSSTDHDHPLPMMPTGAGRRGPSAVARPRAGAGSLWCATPRRGVPLKSSSSQKAPSAASASRASHQARRGGRGAPTAPGLSSHFPPARSSGSPTRILHRSRRRGVSAARPQARACGPTRPSVDRWVLRQAAAFDLPTYSWTGLCGPPCQHCTSPRRAAGLQLAHPRDRVRRRSRSRASSIERAGGRAGSPKRVLAPGGPRRSVVAVAHQRHPSSAPACGRPRGRDPGRRPTMSPSDHSVSAPLASAAASTASSASACACASANTATRPGVTGTAPYVTSHAAGFRDPDEGGADRRAARRPGVGVRAQARRHPLPGGQGRRAYPAVLAQRAIAERSLRSRWPPRSTRTRRTAS